MLTQTIQNVLDTAVPTAEKVLKDHNLPGLGVGIVYKGEIIFAQGFGKANIEQEIPATADTVFRIASVSKTFAAVALMQLWEQGKFDLHAPVNDYLRDYKVTNRRSDAPPVTFHHLLTHTAGLGEFTKLYNYLRPQAHFNVVRPSKPVPPLKKLYGRRLSAECLPGEKWCYANNGFATVGQLVADISGQPFPAYVREHILAPAGMAHSDFWRSERVKDALAVGYNYKAKKKRFKPVIDLEQVTTAAGAMYATVNDMGRYMMALIGCGAPLLKPETLAMMFTPQYQLDARLQGMGYGFKVDDFDGRRVVSHDGLWLGFVSSMFVAPTDELGVIVLTNSANSIAIGLARSFMRRLLGISRALKKSSDEALPDTPALWPSLVGHYGPKPGFNSNFRLWTSYGGELEVYEEENHLKLRSLKGSWKTGKILRRAEADDPLSFTIGGRKIIFKRDPDRLLMGLNAFEKRPYARSIRFRLKLIPIAIALLAIILWLIF